MHNTSFSWLWSLLRELKTHTKKKKELASITNKEQQAMKLPTVKVGWSIQQGRESRKVWIHFKGFVYNDVFWLNV